MQTETKCYFCSQPITGPTEIEHHHPDKANFPDWTEPAHPGCHTRYHQACPEQGRREANHFKDWGSQSPYAGRPGYERVIAKWPGFHRMGGLARARTARRDERGRFTVAEPPSTYASNVWHGRVQEQTEKMATGPFLDDDDYTLVVPSEWYNEAAVRFWKSKGFEWRPKTATWVRDTRKPLDGETYTPKAWLTATRRQFYRFWPGLLQPHHTHLRTGKSDRQRYTDWERAGQRYIEGEYGAYIEH